jgi:glycosyltransferase involved in cell wall biosynthesis
VKPPHPPLVSVVMPAYNAERYVALAVEGLLRQTLRDFELLVIDDGSTDGTAAILDRFAARDSRIAVIHQPANQGYARALNLGLARARGRFIARHDADDVSLPERLARQAQFLEAHPEVGLAASRVQVVDEAGRALAVDPYAGGLDNAALQRELLDHNPLCHGSVMLRRACLAQTGPYDESVELTEDYDLWLRLAEITQLAKLPEVLYQYRHHGASVSHTRRGQQMVAQGRTLENAMRRRHGERVAPSHFASAAESYRMAATFYLEQGDREACHQWLSRALAVCPDLFEDPRVYVPLPPDDFDFAERVFGALPATRRHARLARRLRGRWHMGQFFDAWRRGQPFSGAAHLWPGLTSDPRWLLNRGVWVLGARTVLRRLARTRREVSPG